MSKLFVDQVDPKTATTLTLGTSGDTITVPTGVGLTATDEVKTNKISPASGTAFTLGDSGDTFTVPSGVTFANSGTATGFGESNNPSFSAIIGAHQSLSDNVLTKVAFSTATYATSGTYDTTNYKFTPGVAGNYQFSIGIVADSQANTNLYAVMIKLYKNGSAISTQVDGVNSNYIASYPRQVQKTFDVSAVSNTTDYFEVYCAINNVSSTPRIVRYGSYFNAFRISASA